MRFVEIAKKIQDNIAKGKQAFFTEDIQKQKAYLDSFPQPIDLIERSYYQYLCQMKQIPALLRFVQYLTSVPLLLIRFFSKPKDAVLPSEKNIAAFISGLNDLSYIPETLKKRYDDIVYQGLDGLSDLTKKDKMIIKKIYKRYWYSPYFVLKCIMKMEQYSKAVYGFNPCAIITFGEFSYTSSVLTYYCNCNGIKHINVMHGEKLYNLRDAFVQFDEYYVWDKHYVDLMKSLRAEAEQFRIEIPPVLNLKISRELEKDYDLTYYLGNESIKELQTIRDSLNRSKYDNKRICIRFHPRYSDIEEIKSIFSDFIIENPKDVTLTESLSRTNNAASLYSTVLYQAYVNGVNIIVDDVSFKDKYEKLSDLGYIIMSMKHDRLSEYLIHR